MVCLFPTGWLGSVWAPPVFTHKQCNLQPDQPVWVWLPVSHSLATHSQHKHGLRRAPGVSILSPLFVLSHFCRAQCSFDWIKGLKWQIVLYCVTVMLREHSDSTMLEEPLILPPALSTLYHLWGDTFRRVRFWALLVTAVHIFGLHYADHGLLC